MEVAALVVPVPWSAGSVVAGSARAMVTRSTWAAGSVVAGFSRASWSVASATARLVRCRCSVASGRRGAMAATTRWRSGSGTGRTGADTQRGCPEGARDGSSGHQLFQFHGPSPVYLGIQWTLAPT